QRREELARRDRAVQWRMDHRARAEQAEHRGQVSAAERAKVSLGKFPSSHASPSASGTTRARLGETQARSFEPDSSNPDGDARMTDRQPSKITNLDQYGDPVLPWSRPHDLLASGPNGPLVGFFLGTVRPNGRPLATVHAWLPQRNRRTSSTTCTGR